jgi:hypothetical protein
MRYHIGLIRGSGKVKCWGNGHRRDTLIVQMRRNKDLLSPDLCYYIGERITTKAHYRRNPAELLRIFNAKFGEEFRRVFID